MLSHLYSFFTFPNIGSPIEFSGHYGLFLKEFVLTEMPDCIRRDYIRFCYPEDMLNRDKEIAYDRQYWPYTSTIIVWDSPCRIIGAVQLIPKNKDKLLPIEYAEIVEDKSGKSRLFDVEINSNGLPSMEIYRLRRSFDIESCKAPILVTMMFKAIWAKIIETKTRYLYLNYDSESIELGNLYKNRLDFKDTGIQLRYNGTSKKWNVLRKDCLAHEQEYANRSPRNFYFQTYCRTNLKRKRYRITVKAA